MIHGYGSNEQDLFSFSRAIPEKFTIISLRGDIEIQYNGYAWYNISLDYNGNKSYDTDKAIESRNNIFKTIEICKNKYNIDPNNITLLGFSQGSMLVNAVALTFPDKIRNVVSLSGAFDPNIINLSSSDSLKKLSFYISHGLNDEILPFDFQKKV
jgi:phospholipase/carboxylesterase